MASEPTPISDRCGFETGMKCICDVRGGCHFHGGYGRYDEPFSQPMALPSQEIRDRLIELVRPHAEHYAGSDLDREVLAWLGSLTSP